MILKKNTKISLDKFIEKSLYDKSKGYYNNKNPFGAKGDFVTSPSISVMFSEMITIWLISFWKQLGRPKKINIVELGAGTGDMINQILKTIENFGDFKKSTNFYIHEVRIKLKKIQKNKNNNYDIEWIDNLNKISKYPTIFIANEFFDALPVKQFIKKKNKWFEKYICLKGNKLQFINIKIDKWKIEKIINEKITEKESFIEYSSLAFQKLNIISKIIKKQNGGILIIDYGYNTKKMYDTLQSVKNHKKNDLFENIYKSDITHMINFYFYKKKIKKIFNKNGNFTKSRTTKQKSTFF